MKIAARFRLNMLLLVSIVVVVGVILFISLRHIQTLIRKNTVVDSMMTGIFELNLVTHEYVLFQRERASIQWNNRYESLGRIIRRDDLFRTYEEQALIREIRQNHAGMKTVFSKLENFQQRHTPLNGRTDPPPELESRLIALLLTKSQTMMSDARQLTDHSHGEMAAAQQRANIIVMLFVAIIVMSVLMNSWLLRRSILIPLQTLQQSIRDIGEGRWERRVASAACSEAAARDEAAIRDKAAARDEVDELSRAFDRMIRQLERTTVSRDELTQEIAERQLAESQREQLIKELEAKNTELERFTYTVSHDLKAPLITIQGFLDMLCEDMSSGDAEQISEDIKHIAYAAKRMHELLTDLLELSRIGRIVNASEQIAVADLVAETRVMLEAQLVQQNIRLEIVSELPTIVGDRIRLRQVFENLIENAVKFMGAEPDPRIDIGSRDGDGHPVIYVRDNGIGIEPRDQEKVFELFQRLDHHTGGTGIGLATVKRIIDLHGGRIWVESEGEGSGTTMCFTLPIAAEDCGVLP